MKKERKEYCKAWTLIELMLVIAIVAILAGIAIPTYTNYIDKSRNSQAIADIGEMALEIMKFWAEHGDFPNTLAQVGLANRLDPWENPYQYLKIQGVPKNQIKGKWRKDRFLVPINYDYDLYSMGKDGKSKPPLTAKHSWDDIVRANGGAYIGLASEY
ncbi:MAG: prepilin-type N-terminal cleavage/methylation domain-containing protein [Deltaproteobacteria bacterium]|nr:prepilin-type N-terminal cleavage/methylation domain-containing protein [Deltaproteobacteria bacterium]